MLYMSKQENIFSNTLMKYGILFVLLMTSNMVFATDENESLTSSDYSSGSKLNWSASAGLGYDSNIYRAPSDPYLDYGPTPTPDPTDPVIPEIFSDVFVPLKYKVRYEDIINNSNALIAQYRFSGKFYADSDFSNANTMKHTIKLGNEHVLNKRKRLRDSVYAGFIYDNKKSQYLDRDGGDDQETSGGSNVSDRYVYNAVGIETRYDHRTSPVKYSFEFKLLNRDYEKVAISELDHKYILISGDIKFRLSRFSKLKFKYKHYEYDYDERPSRSSDGRLPPNNPPREYVYDEFLVSYILRASKNLKTYFTYSYTTRSDEYVGYNDYERNKIKLKALYEYSKKVNINAALTYWERDYPNAFAFDRFVLGENEEDKNYDGMKLELDVDYSLDKHQTFWIDFEWRDENSTDLRYEYDRSIIMTGVKWDY
jgi:hypothetical protein